MYCPVALIASNKKIAIVMMVRIVAAVYDFVS